MKKVLVLFAHPYFEYSQASQELVSVYTDSPVADFRDLYEDYPDFHIAAFRERKRLVNYDAVIFHFPMLWFGMPPLLKLWIDEVFDMQWVGKNERGLLENVDAYILMTVGGSEEDFSKGGAYETSAENYLKNLQQSLKLTGVNLRKFITVYDADGLRPEKMLDVKREIGEILKRY